MTVVRASKKPPINHAPQARAVKTNSAAATAQVRAAHKRHASKPRGTASNVRS